MVPDAEVSIQVGGPAGAVRDGVSIQAGAMRVEDGVIRARTPVTLTITSNAPVVVSIYGGGQLLELTATAGGSQSSVRAERLVIARDAPGGALQGQALGSRPTVVGESRQRPPQPPAIADSFGVVQGVVMGPEGHPIAGATVAVTGTTRGDVTDANGQYLITRVPLGQRRLRVGGTAYTEATRELVVIAGDTVRVDIRLSATGARQGMRLWLIDPQPLSFPPEVVASGRDR